MRTIPCPRCKEIIDADRPCPMCSEFRPTPLKEGEVSVWFSCNRCMARGFAAAAACYQTSVADCPRCGGKMRWHSDLNRFLTTTEEELADLAARARRVSGISGRWGGSAGMSFHPVIPPVRRSERG